MAFAWRPARAGDLAAITAIAAAVHPGYPEGEAVFAERLSLFPEGCRILADDAPAGYLLSHPWVFGEPPKLDSLLGALPERPSTYYVHDLGLLVQARGRGHAGTAIRDVIAMARRLGLATVSLVAVNDTTGFWRRFGFRLHDDPGLAAWLRSYDEDAAYMVLSLDQG